MSNEIGRLIHHYDVEGVLILGQREHRPFQWRRVSLLTQIRIRFVRQRSAPTLEQTNVPASLPPLLLEIVLSMRIFDVALLYINHCGNGVSQRRPLIYSYLLIFEIFADKCERNIISYGFILFRFLKVS